MKVRSVMTAEVKSAQPADSVHEVARRVSEIDTGVMPVCEGSRVIGLITDRDIVLRVVAEGLEADTPVSEVMTTALETCGEDDDVDEVVERMGERQIRRMIVLGEGGALAGVLSLGDVAHRAKAKTVGRALDAISDAGDEPSA